MLFVNCPSAKHTFDLTSRQILPFAFLPYSYNLGIEAILHQNMKQKSDGVMIKIITTANKYMFDIS